MINVEIDWVILHPKRFVGELIVMVLSILSGDAIGCCTIKNLYTENIQKLYRNYTESILRY